jgi:pimeloyl-ACP methyl ester carboxylesterase
MTSAAPGSGATTRETVILFHSSAGSSRQWSALVERLAPRFAVHAVDLHGHGTRPAWNSAAALTLADEAALAEPIVRSAGRVHLVGHSYGGAVALTLAARHPESVASVAVYEPVLFRWLFDDDPHSAAAREPLEVAEAMHKYLSRGDAYRAASVFLAYWCGHGLWESMSVARRDGAAQRMRTVLSHFDALFEDGLSPFRLRRLPMPMLFLSGARTVASTRRIAELLRAALPEACHEVLPEMDHMGPVTHVEAVNRRIASFVQQEAQRPQQEWKIA